LRSPAFQRDDPPAVAATQTIAASAAATLCMSAPVARPARRAALALLKPRSVSAKERQTTRLAAVALQSS